MRRLSLSGIDINKLAPSLFESDHNDYSQKQVSIIDWYLPDFDKIKRGKGTTKKDSLDRSSDDSKKISLSNNKL